MNVRLITSVTAAGAMLVMGSPTWSDTREPTPPNVTAAPVVSPARAPTEAEDLAVEWITVKAPGVGVLLAAVARPSGSGPFPAVLLLHGSHGFAREYVQLAQELSRQGILAVAACWFAGGGAGDAGDGSSFVSPPFPCPEAPPRPVATSPEARQSVEVLVQTVRGLPGVRADRIALFGHSRGGGAALNYVLSGGTVRAAVLESIGYPAEVTSRATAVNVPLLMLHGVADGPADGGSAVTNIEMARNFEAALRAAGKSVEVMYYERGGHSSLFSSPPQHEDEVRRIVAFLLSRLRADG